MLFKVIGICGIICVLKLVLEKVRKKVSYICVNWYKSN